MSPTTTRQFALQLFDPPTTDRELPGFLDLENQTRHIITRMIAESRKDRYIIAAEMARDMEKDVTHHMLNGYPVTFERLPVLTGILSGYLIQNPA
ncbi:MAG: hypothetical protein HQM02_10790 [Magnetococcales bacterium]|nr:hypothetical protein [Magnetococcales bacterium]